MPDIMITDDYSNNKLQSQLQEPQKPQQHDSSLYNQLIKSNSSGSSNSNTIIQSASCACKHGLVSTNTKYCRLCLAIVPLLDGIQTEKQQLKERIRSLQEQLDEKSSLLESYTRDCSTLNAQYVGRKQQCDTTMLKIENLRHDIHFLKTKHTGKIAHILEIEKSKKGVEIELHDLSQKLLEEANALVLVEKKEKLILQQEHDQIESALEKIQTELTAVQTELYALREAMSNQPLAKTTAAKTTHENYILRAQLNLSTLFNVPQPIEINPNTPRDPLLLQEFGLFLQSLEITSMAKLNSLPFMRYCIKSDIEPCLKFGKAITKKLLDAIISKTCLIEECPQDFIDLKKKLLPTKAKSKSRLWGFSSPSSSTTEPIIINCYTCGKEMEAEKDQMWKFRTSYFDEWALIDGYCRDRINSVISLYSWLRQLKMQEKKPDVSEAYREFAKLQLQILLSRMGTLSCLLSQFGLE